MSVKQIKPFPTRINDDLREYLQLKADNQKRSLNNEIVDRLEITKMIENIINKPLGEVINDIIKSSHIEEDYNLAIRELAALKESHDALKNELTKAFSLSGGTNKDIARMKVEKALNYIESGVTELRAMFPDKDKK